jgi:L-histidine N-alpha-methyltransferase
MSTPATVAEATRIAAATAGRWHDAARLGLADEQLCAVAVQLLELAADHAETTTAWLQLDTAASRCRGGARPHTIRSRTAKMTTAQPDRTPQPDRARAATHLTLQIELTDADLEAALRQDARLGLTATPKSLPPKWFYDARGSELFEEITRLPEYFPTRTERALLEHVSGEIARAVAGVEVLVELGSGSSEKTRLLLSALSAEGPLKVYVPQDVSVDALTAAAERIAVDHPQLVVAPVVGDFTATLRRLPGRGRRMIAFLGGTIGNLPPVQRAQFLTEVGEALQPGEHLLLGAGLVTDPAVLVPAYDDAAGVTAEFNRNVLRVLNMRLGADFEPDEFVHVALWDSGNEWIEMRLEASRDMTVHIAELGLDVAFAAGEQLHTEISAKFHVDGLTAELSAAGMKTTANWTDPHDRFTLTLAERI